jgi:hypothetical protein
MIVFKGWQLGGDIFVSIFALAQMSDTFPLILEHTVRALERASKVPGKL